MFGNKKEKSPETPRKKDVTQIWARLEKNMSVYTAANLLPKTCY